MSKIRSYFYRPKHNSDTVKVKRWKPLSILGTAVRKTCTIIGAMILLSALISTCTIMTIGGSGANAPLPNDMVLLMTLEQGVTETQTKPSLLEPFPFMQPTLRNIVDSIDRAKTDNRVRGIIFSLKGGSVGLAHAQEIRAAILRFRESGKFTKIYAPSYAGGAGGLVQYYLASAFDEVWMQPVGMLSVSGLSLEQPFAKNVMDALGISAQFLQREEFKSAMENFTNSEMSSENREALTSILESWTSEIISGISQQRSLDEDSISNLINLGLLTGEEALKYNLIDKLDYADLMLPEIQKIATGNSDDETVELVKLGAYYASKPKVKKDQPRTNIALINVSGSIVDSDKTGGRAGASEISAAIGEAIKDNSIDVIVVRVNSPGGSPTASETIRRALQKARAKGKTVITSMGPMAASGGYWIAAETDRIFAGQATLTGSIGVVMGKFEASGLWNKIGVNWEGPQIGENADIWSINAPFDDTAMARLNILIDETYEAFLKRVSEGRKLSPEQVRQVAKGRAYTGEQALALNLVDEIGGLEVALDYAAREIGLKDRNDLNVQKFPKDLSGVERVLQMFGQEVSMSQFMKLSMKKSFGVDSKISKQTAQLSEEFYLFTEQSPIAVYDPMAAALQ